MLRQAKESELPFINDDGSGSGSDNSFNSDDEEDVDKKADVDLDDSNLQADGNVSSHSGSSIIGSDEEDSPK